MSTVNQITGGPFTDSLGNPLANGYLIFTLGQDSTVNTSMEVPAGFDIKIPLDSNGDIVTSPVYSLWPNDVLTPSGTYYLATAYTASGQRVWGPDKQTVLSTPSPFNISSWIP